MASVEGAVPAQVPGSNQYWEHIKSKDRAYFIGRDPDGRMVWQCEGDGIEVGNLDWSGWRHIPGCTGWDWEPEKEDEFPQWYILKDDEKRSWVPDWTIKRTGEETAIRYARDEAGELYATDEQWTGAAECWQRCSALEAYDRLGTRSMPEVPPAPRRVPVKLWVTYRLNDEGGDWPVRATQADQTCQNWKEIKFDGNGAFIEVEQ